jgi:hypothetical protein
MGEAENTHEQARRGGAVVWASAPQEHAGQGGPRLHHRRLRRGYPVLDPRLEIVAAALQVAEEGMRPADQTYPGERREPAHRAQPPLQMLVIMLDTLLGRLTSLVRDGGRVAASAGG